MNTARDYAAAINALLAPVALAAFGAAEAARLTDRRRFVWELVADEFEGPAGRGREGQQIKTRVISFVVHVSGSSDVEVEKLRSALVTATGKAMGGHTSRNYRLGRAEWGNVRDGGGVWVCSQALDLVVPFQAVELPASGQPPQDPTDDLYTRVTITARAIESADIVETLPP